MSDFTRIDPTGRYQLNNKVSQVLSATGGFSGSNNQIVAAVTGQVIRLMGAYLQSSTSTAAGVFFKNGNGGTVLWNVGTVPVTTNGLYTFFPIIDCGYIETTVGTGLFADISTATAYVTIFYITYTPS